MALPFAAGDCETDPFFPGRIPEPFIWGLFDGSEYRQTTDIHEYLLWLHNYKGIVYFHNGGKFDFHYLVPYLTSVTDLRVISGRIAEFRIGQCILRDSFLLLPTGLAAFQKTDFDYAKLEKDARKKHWKDICDYLRDDCVNLYNYLQAFFDVYPRGLTLAGTALKVWRSMDGRVDSSNKAFYDELSPYYYGGRCQVFAPGIHEGKINIYDIKSAYPRAMLEEHPAGTSMHCHRKFKESSARRSFYHIHAESLGALPHRSDDGSIRFPTGEQDFYCTGHELLTGLETETIVLKKIHRVITFVETVNYKQYVDHFYDLKLRAETAGDKTQRLFAKLFLNSLYGKAAANPSKYREYIIAPYGSPAPFGYEPDNVLGGLQLFSRELAEEKQHYYNLATAASITGWVRAYLWQSIRLCSDVIYCDTDSIITKDTNPKLPISDKLGDWSLEAECVKFSVAGKKLYAARICDGTTKTASKGVRLSADEIEKVANGDEITYTSNVPTYSILNGIGFTTRKIKLTQ